MRINVDVSLFDCIFAVDWIGRIIGDDVDRRVTEFERREKRNPLLTNHFREHYDIEFALARTRWFQKKIGRLPRRQAYDAFYGLLVAAHRIHRELHPPAKGAFEGRLRNSISDRHGFRPLAYEVSIATHLMRTGWDVEFADYAGLGRFDLLARRNNAEIEIECKTTSGDGGRKIHRQEVNRLADLLLPTTERLVETRGCHLLRITVPDRLGKTDQELMQIAETFANAADRKNMASCDLARVDYEFDGLCSWPNPGEHPEARDFFEEKFGARNVHLMFHNRRHFAIVAVVIASQKRDTVVATLSEQAKDAADQCSGKRPAIVALQLIDQIDRQELQSMLKTPNGLHAIAHSVFSRESRSHVDSIAFSVPPRSELDGLGVRRISAPALVLNNPNPKFQSADVRTIFRSEK